MAEDTAQPTPAAETNADPIAVAAEAFKAYAEPERKLPPRAEDGKFTRAEQEAAESFHDAERKGFPKN